MSDLMTEVSGFVSNWLNQLGITSTYIGLQWALIQFSIILVAFAGALILNRWLSPSLEAYVRNIKGQPQLLAMETDCELNPRAKEQPRWAHWFLNRF